MPLFFIAILPPEDITENIRDIQHVFEQDYNSRHQLKIPVHITLVPPFNCDQESVPALKSSLLKFSSRQYSFPIRLNGFQTFRKKVIYIAVEENEKLQILNRSLYTFLDANTHVNPPKHFDTFTPHITVANRDLKPEAFDRAWKDFGQKEFKSFFTVTDIALLRHDQNVWQIVLRCPFRA